MARCAGGAGSLARYAGAVFAAARRLLLAASEGCFGRGAEIGGVLTNADPFRRRTCPPRSGNAGQVRHLNKEEICNAKIRDRERDSRRREHDAPGLASCITDVLRSSAKTRAADSVAAQLCYRRQNLLRLYCAE